MAHRYTRIAEKNLGIARVDGAEVTALCPFHDDSSPSFRFNTHTGLWVCFACGERGNIKSFTRRLGTSAHSSSLEVLEAQVESLRIQINRSNKASTSQPDERELLRYGFPHAAWGERGFTKAVVKRWGLGYDPVSNSLTIPAYTHRGVFAGAIYKNLDPGKGQGRYTYPRHFPRKSELFASWGQVGGEWVALVEGPLDAVRVWQAGVPALAVYGSFVSQDQVALLHKLMVKGVVLFFDNDEAGHKATTKCLENIRTIFCTSVDWSPYEYGTDPGDLSLVSIRNLFRRAI